MCFLYKIVNNQNNQKTNIQKYNLDQNFKNFKRNNKRKKDNQNKNKKKEGIN